MDSWFVKGAECFGVNIIKHMYVFKIGEKNGQTKYTTLTLYVKEGTQFFFI